MIYLRRHEHRCISQTFGGGFRGKNLSQLAVVSVERHGRKKWLPFRSFAFSSSEAIAPIVAAELASAALELPLAFSQAAAGYAVVAVLSLVAGRNMCVDQQGRWLSGYVPAHFRSYPFRLVCPEGRSESVLCVDESSGLVVEDGPDGLPFFDDAGVISPELSKALDFLTQIERSRRATEVAVSALAKAGVIVPWPIQVKSEQGSIEIKGLFRIDERAIGIISDDAFLGLRAASAFSVAYSQLLSTGQLRLFERLARTQDTDPPLSTSPLPDTFDALFGSPDNDIVHFD
jgi:SapC